MRWLGLFGVWEVKMAHTYNEDAQANLAMDNMTG